MLFKAEPDDVWRMQDVRRWAPSGLNGCTIRPGSDATAQDRVPFAAMGRRARVTAAGAFVALAGATPVASMPDPPRERVVFGHSVRHRPITATLVGDPLAPHRVLVVGCLHGSERAGEAVTGALRHVALPAGVALWLVDQANPDGCHDGTRQNARGVDLNRNQRTAWRPLDRRGGLYWSGPKALSEPESQAIVRLVRRVRPTVSIWYHQHARLVDDSGGDRRILRRYARAAGLAVGRLGPYPGTVTGWQNATHPHTTAFVVELPAGRLRPAALRRHVAAVLAVARGELAAEAGAQGHHVGDVLARLGQHADAPHRAEALVVGGDGGRRVAGVAQ